MRTPLLLDSQAMFLVHVYINPRRMTGCSYASITQCPTTSFEATLKLGKVARLAPAASQ